VEPRALRYRFAYMSTLEIVIHVEALAFAAFGMLISLSGIASLWAFRKIARLAS
jgi:ABC-type lipoprotein release transport system permease subunit